MVYQIAMLCFSFQLSSVHIPGFLPQPVTGNRNFNSKIYRGGESNQLLYLCHLQNVAIMKYINGGKLYRFFIDPLLNKMHRLMTSRISTGQHVLDIACGNGTLALKMARRAGHVTAIDLSEASIQYASERKKMNETGNIDFIQANATDIDIYEKIPFDSVVLSMAIHQFSSDDLRKILTYISNYRAQLFVLDYASPMARSWKGFAANTIERAAGREHYNNYRVYQSEGGAKEILKNYGIEIEHVYISTNGVFQLVSGRS